MGDGARHLSPAFAGGPQPTSLGDRVSLVQTLPGPIPHDLPVPRRAPPIVRTDEEVTLPPPADATNFPVGLDYRVGGAALPVALSAAARNRPVDHLAPRPNDELLEHLDDEGNTVYYQYKPQTDTYTYHGLDRPSLRHQPPDNYNVLLNQSDYYLPPAFDSHPSDGSSTVEVRGASYFPNPSPALVAPLG